MARSQKISTFLHAVDRAMARVTGPGVAVAEAFVARMAVQGAAGEPPARLPVCDWIAPALAGQTDALAIAFAAIEPQLCWKRRLSADPADEVFWNGHANALILGPGGLEDRGDLWVGVTIMAPGTLYPDHDHPPAEVYLPLSAGEWWNSDMPWTDPGRTGFIYNRPGIKHAMRAGKTPFLALWILPV